MQTQLPEWSLFATKLPVVDESMSLTVMNFLSNRMDIWRHAVA
jgi:hypothetical protein